MGYGKVEISFALLGESLSLPKDTQFITVEPGVYELTFQLILSHPDIKNDGRTPIECQPTFKQQPAIILEAWNERE